jgi:hypothetical protein
MLLPLLMPLLCYLLLQGPGLACLERLLAGPPSTDAPAGSGMQGDDTRSSGTTTAAASDAAAGSAAAGADAGAGCAACAGGDVGDDDGEGASLLSDDGAGDGRVWFVGERISIADIAVADLVSAEHMSESRAL